MFVSVCICTYNRPAIANTIASILSQQRVSLSTLEIIVCDEEDSRTPAKQLVEQLSSSSPAPIRYITCNARNLAICRSACIDAAEGEWVAFIDDDEIAEADWLAELLAAQVKFNADVVKSFVKGIYPAEAPNWVKQCDPFTRDFGPTGTRLRFVATNGVIFRRAYAIKNGIKFDPKFGSGGGEDPDFFLKFYNSGAVMISCRSSVVYEHVPLGRLNMGYFRRRFWTDGYVYGVLYLSQLRSIHKIVLIAKSGMIIGLCLLYPLVMLTNLAVGFNMFKKLWAHFGIFYWAVGGQRTKVEAVS